MSPNDAWLQELAEVGAYLEGHFLLTTGRHSNQFFLLARLTEHPRRLDRWAEQLARLIEPYRPVTIAGPAVGGIIPAYAVGRHIDGARVIFAEKSGDGAMIWKRGFRVSPGERVAVIEDAVTTGHSAHQVVQLVRQHGGDVVVVGALVDRHAGPLPDWPAFQSVLRVENVPSWLPDDCPLCRAGIPLTRPKS